jgi:hypothetical protein
MPPYSFSPRNGHTGGGDMKVRTLLITMLAVAGGLAGAAPAFAQDPAGCNANRLSLDLIRDKTLVKNGDVINYFVEIANVGNAACKVSSVTAQLRFPAPDGTSTGAQTTVVTNATYNAQQPILTFGPFAYTVNANAGVSRLEAKVSIVGGLLHDTAVPSPFNADKTIGTTIPKPGIEVDKVADIKNGPQNVKYTFRVYNRTSPPATLDNVTLSDNLCPDVVGPVSGDDGDKRLQPAEVWVYTCTMQHGVGTFTNTATACGELILNGGPMPKVCDTDDETVVFTPLPPESPPPLPPASPPPPATPNPVPEVAVKPTAVNQAPCTLARASSTTVRAGQLNTIRVRVRNVDAGTTVKITLPGGKTVSAKTNKSGVATLRVRPTKSGTARIQAAECSDVERLSVKPARRVVAQRAPRVTG